MKFEISDEELKNFHLFTDKHKECLNKYGGAIGGHITYMFTPTSIGMVTKIKCSMCDKVEDITDYDTW